MTSVYFNKLFYCYQCRYNVIQWSRVWRFVVGAELAVQSQQRRTTVHDTHSCSQHCLVLEQTSGSWAGAWTKRATVLVIGRPWLVGSKSVPGPETVRSKAALASRRLSPGHQQGPGDCRARLATTVRKRRRHTEVGQVTWRMRRADTSIPGQCVYTHRNSHRWPYAANKCCWWWVLCNSVYKVNVSQHTWTSPLRQS